MFKGKMKLEDYLVNLFKRKPKQIDISNIKIQGPYGPIPILFNLGPDLQKSVDKLFYLIEGKENVETKLVPCKGANDKCNEIIAMVTLEHKYPVVRCPRDLRGLNDHYDEGFCYCGDDRWRIPIIQEFEFATNKIFPCPYAKLK